MGETIVELASQTEEDFIVFSTTFCPYCVAAKRLLDSKGLTYKEINFDNEPQMRMDVVKETGHRTVPVIIDNRGNQPIFIGGFDETQQYFRSVSNE